MKRSPFEPGKSPFRVKGGVYLATREYHDTRVAGGYAATCEKLASPLRKFAEQRFVMGGWYDALPLTDLAVAAAHACGVPFHSFVREGGLYQAERDIRGVYRVLLKLVSPESIASRLGKLAGLYFAFGEASAELVSPGRAVATHRGVPALLVPFYLAASEGFTQAALTATGARGVSVRWPPPQEDGARDGVATMTVRLELSWRTATVADSHARPPER